MVFFDNASTTRVNDEVSQIINKYNSELYYNPSAIYLDGFNVSKDINNARKNILARLGGSNLDNFIFTSCATESNNMVLRACIKKSSHALVSMGEHPSVYKTALDMKNNGYDIEFVNLDKDGKVDLEDFKRKMVSDVDFVSIMHVNNETGAINDIAMLCKYAKSVNNKVLFHSDGVQAFGKIAVNVRSLNVDFYTISGHKIYGPKGVGGLFVKDDRAIKPLLFGGGQEKNLRSGTENVSGIMALDKASEIVINNFSRNYDIASKFNNYVRANLKDAIIVSPVDASPYVLMVAFDKCRAETILHMMEEKGYIIGNGSACSSKKRENRNMLQMGYTQSEIEGSIRISFSVYNTEDEVIGLVKALNEVVKEYKSKVIR